MDFIDLRSDTVTLPTPEMREAMAEAVVGDDVMNEDPTVIQLQNLAAQRMGKKAALFVPSGTMGNLLAAMCHCGRGDEVIMGNLGHTFLFEGGGISALGSIFAHLLPNQKDGTITLAEIEAGIRPDDIHQPPTRLLILENTHNRCGGVALTAEYTKEAAKLVHKHDMRLHIDGARIFNAAAALGIEASKLVKECDSVTFCLSKGLCAPVGSVLCGDEAFIQKARRLRKMLGGAMRQAGVMAAAGIIAIEKMSTRLTEDHQRAKALADGLAQIPAIRFEMGLPQTNMVFPSLSPDCKLSAADVAKKLAAVGIKVGVVGAMKFRMVTHYWIDDDAIENVIAAMKKTVR